MGGGWGDGRMGGEIRFTKTQNTGEKLVLCMADSENPAAFSQIPDAILLHQPPAIAASLLWPIIHSESISTPFLSISIKSLKSLWNVQNNLKGKKKQVFFVHADVWHQL